MARYDQVFALSVPVDPPRVWSLLPDVIRKMDGASVRSTDDEAMALDFATGTTTTSWGEEMRVTVHPAGDGSSLRVEGSPTHTLLTTNVGERAHARTIRGRMVEEMQDQLGVPVTVAES